MNAAPFSTVRAAATIRAPNASRPARKSASSTGTRQPFVLDLGLHLGHCQQPINHLGRLRQILLVRQAGIELSIPVLLPALGDVPFDDDLLVPLDRLAETVEGTVGPSSGVGSKLTTPATTSAPPISTAAA